MERRILQPEQIIVPGEYELGNESILQIYFRVFDRGHGGDLPPAIAINKSQGAPYFGGLGGQVDEYNDALQDYLEKNPNAQYFLLDGNHKSVAAALNHAPIHTLELQVDEDIARCKDLVEKGELFNWTIPGESLKEIIDKLGDHLFFNGYGRKGFSTVDNRVKKLTSNGDLPQYMKERYIRGK